MTRLRVDRVETRRAALLATVALVACAPAGPARAAPCTEPGCPAAGWVFAAEEVAVAAAPLPGNRMPSATQAMLEAWRPQRATLQFVVDTLGAVERPTVRVLDATHEDWAYAVRAAAARWRFRPAERDGARVRQLVRTPVEWSPLP